MHIKNTILAAAATIGMTVSSYAATYATGDLLVGFVATGGISSNQTLIVNLGSSASFRDGFDSGTFRLNFRNIGAALNSQFSPNLGDTPWYDRTDLRINIYGSTSSNTVGEDLVNLDPFRTSYVSRSRTAATGSTATYSVANNAGMTTAASQIQTTTGTFQLATETSPGVAVVNDSPNSVDQFTRPAVSPGSAFGAFSNGIDQTFSAGSLLTFPGVGPVEAALDLYRLQAVNDVPGQYGSGAAIRTGAYKGTFTLSNTGAISFVPEPSSTVVLGLTGLLGLLRRRRA